MRLRISVLGTMTIVAFVAISLVTLRSTLEIWASLLFTLEIVLLCFAIPSLLYRRGPSRAFWVGFAAFGWTYVVFCFGPVLGTSMKPPPLLTTKLLQCSYPYLITVPSDEVYVWGKGKLKDGRNIQVTHLARGGQITFFRNDTEDFMRTGHTLFSLLFSCLGGFVSRRLFIASRHGTSS